MLNNKYKLELLKGKNVYLINHNNRYERVRNFKHIYVGEKLSLLINGIYYNGDKLDLYMKQENGKFVKIREREVETSVEE